MDNIIGVISKSNNIVLLCHNNPDGDAIGSSLALYFALKRIGKDVIVVVNDVPKKFCYLNGYDDIVSESNSNYDLAIVLDTANKDRVNDPSGIIDRAREVMVIDHHVSNTRYGNENLVEELPACCQIVYNLIKKMNIVIDNDIAMALMTGLLTDTGGFSHQDVAPSTFAMAEDLCKIVDVSLIYDKALRVISRNQFDIKMIALNNLEFYCDGKIAFFYITSEDMVETGVDQSDCGILVSVPLEIDGVEVSIFLRRYLDRIRISLRSKHIDVNRIMSMFGGGGHVNAAGATVTMAFDDVKNELIKEVGKSINEWDISCK